MIVTAPSGAKPPEQESQHWYTRDGAPCYQQTTAKGGLRATSLADARKLGLIPSVTTVLSVVEKPALTNWKVEQGILAALTLTRNPGEGDRDFLARVMVDSKQQGKAAAEEGTRIHDACESAMKGAGYPLQYVEHVIAARTELDRLFPDVSDWIAEASFGHASGYGGKVDLHSPSTGIVVDYKTKDGDFSDGKKLNYDQHIQLAAYQRGLLLPVNVCANIFVSRTHPGAVASHVWKLDDVTHGWAMFEASLALWKTQKKFDPAFSAEAIAA